MGGHADEGTLPYTSALDEQLAQAARDTGAHIGAVYLLTGSPQVLVMEAEIGLPTQLVKPWTTVRLDGGAPVAAAVRQGQLVWVPTAHELARRFPGTALAFPYAFASAAAPLHSDSRMWGSWILLWPDGRPAELSGPEQDVIAATSERLAAVLEQAADSGCPLRPGGEPRVLTPVPPPMPDPYEAVAAAGFLDRLRDGSVALDLDGVVTFASPAAAGLLGTTVSELLGTPLWETATWLKDPAFQDRCRAAVVGQQVASCSARRPDGHELEFVLHPDPTGLSLRITPSAAGLSAQRPARAFTPDDSGLPRADVFYNFLHMASAMTRALNVREVVDLIADHVMPVFKAQAMAIMRAESGRLRIVGSHGYVPEVLERFDGQTLATPSPAEQVVRTGEPAFFADRAELRRAFPETAQDDGMAAWAFLPLTVSDDTFGVCLLAFDHPRPFTAEQCATLTTLAGLMGQALDRALLYDTKDRLAHSLQTSLLPGSLPDMPGLEVAARYVPATRGVGIGGDFYDLIRLNETTAAAVIGDVQGHNMTAAALMGQVRTAIHAHAAVGASPGDVLQHTNRLLMDLDTDLFTSCLLIYFDLRLRTLRAANAGHPLPLLRPPNMPAEIIDIPAGLLLGIDADAEYATVEVPFPPGAVLALYTDGLVEAPGVDLDEAIGTLAAYLTSAPREQLQQVAGTLLDHAPHTDDIALLLLRHRENAG
ncbi:MULTISPECIES: SpoIIE family protein phosphatase [unclassified Nonomuraea]|uniref:SpoIIE family protein phosphatase n=1 Tax=unclassified Nonomuraea TaxID=2593643 RepID=UPI00340F4BF5